MIATLIQLAALFVLLSLLAVGGGAGVIPDMQHAVVDLHHWMTAPEFLDMFAISRAAPGPGSPIVLPVGQHVAGLAGAAVSGTRCSCLLRCSPISPLGSGRVPARPLGGDGSNELSRLLRSALPSPVVLR